jgi:hypothetical protein
MSTQSKVQRWLSKREVAARWHVFVRNRCIGVCADRKAALRLVNTTIKPTGNSKGHSS